MEPFDQDINIQFHKKLPTLKLAIAMLVSESLYRCGGNYKAAAKMIGTTVTSLCDHLDNCEKFDKRPSSNWIT